jgi:tetraacyldisaccharide 4'-kinase
VRVVTATGNPRAVATSATEVGFEVVDLAAYRDHHWFTPDEIRREEEAARAQGARVLVTAKDAVRWGSAGARPDLVLEAEWEWVAGGAAVEERVLGKSDA